MNSTPRFISRRAHGLLAFLALAGSVAVAAVPPRGKLTLERAGDALVVQFGGRPGRVGIPSWKAVVRRDDGGNISNLYIPADDPHQLSSGRAEWPLTIIQGRNREGIDGTMNKARENYAGFRVELFEVLEETPEKIVVRVGGPSPTKHFLHERTYAFTPAGVQVEGWVEPQLEMANFSYDPHWDRRQIADSHLYDLPVRTQGERSWRQMPSSGSDAAVTLPGKVDFPLEAEIRLRRAMPTFVRVLYDQGFEAAAGKRLFIHNNKDQPYGQGGQRLAYEKLTGIVSGPVSKGARQTFKMRFVFETQEWPELLPKRSE